jgi:hypothetical protein
MRSRLALCLALTLALAGCSADAPPVGLAAPAAPAAQTESDARLVERLREVETGAFRRASERQQDYAYTRYRRTEQFTDDGLLAAFSEHTLSVARGGSARIVSADSAGAFDYGLFSRFVSANVSDPDPDDLSDFVLPEDPIFLQDRHTDAYTYRALGDTLLWNRAARVIEVEARPDAGDGYNIRRVRYMIDRSTDELLAVELDRIDLALLYREESTFFLHVRPAPSGAFVPHASRFYTSVWMPFQEVKRIGTVSAYYDYAAQTSAARG